MKKKLVKVVREGDGWFTRAKKGSKTVEIRPKRGEYDTYVSPDSAQRAWRKYARANSVSNYVYEHA